MNYAPLSLHTDKTLGKISNDIFYRPLAVPLLCRKRAAKGFVAKNRKKWELRAWRPCGTVLRPILQITKNGKAKMHWLFTAIKTAKLDTDRTDHYLGDLPQTGLQNKSRQAKIP